MSMYILLNTFVSTPAVTTKIKTCCISRTQARAALVCMDKLLIFISIFFAFFAKLCGASYLYTRSGERMFYLINFIIKLPVIALSAGGRGCSNRKRASIDREIFMFRDYL